MARAASSFAHPIYHTHSALEVVNKTGPLTLCRDIGIRPGREAMVNLTEDLEHVGRLGLPQNVLCATAALKGESKVVLCAREEERFYAGYSSAPFFGRRRLDILLMFRN